MRAEINSEAWSVRADRMLVLHALGGRVLHCGEGRIWLTEEGTGEDVVLHAGDCYQVRGDGKLLLEAAGEAHLRLLPVRGRCAGTTASSLAA